MQVSDLGMIEVNEAPPPLDLIPQEIEGLAEEWVHDHRAVADRYYRVEQAHWASTSLQGLLLPIERTSIEPMAWALEGGKIQALQPCIGQGQWQETPRLQRHWAMVDETLGEAEGVWMVDGAERPKQGEHAVGVARQWGGHVGKVDHGQAGVCAAYASRQGSPWRDRRLSLPDAWCDAAHRERWTTCGLPETTCCTTKPAWALEMLQAAGGAGTLRLRWGACEAACGRETALLDGVAAVQRWYGAEGPHATQRWLQRPAPAVPAWSGRGRRPRKARLGPGEAAPQRVAELAAALPPEAWQPFLMTEGSQGPRVAEWAFPRSVAVRAGLPGPDVWLVWRRGWGENPERTVSLSNAPASTPVAVLVRVAGMRWPMATACEERKGGWGLDHDEVRSWLGWHHPMTLCLLAHHGLVRARRRVKKGRRP